MLGAGEPPALPLLPLARCGAAGCGGRGWCEAAGGATRCGCFVAGGLAAGVGGASCDDPKVWRAHRQPAPHADFQPRCPQDCLRRGDCDWQGFCRCRRGFWGLDCALTRGRRRCARRRPPRRAAAAGGGGGRAARLRLRHAATAALWQPVCAALWREARAAIPARRAARRGPADGGVCLPPWRAARRRWPPVARAAAARAPAGPCGTRRGRHATPSSSSQSAPSTMRYSCRATPTIGRRGAGADGARAARRRHPRDIVVALRLA